MLYKQILPVLFLMAFTATAGPLPPPVAITEPSSGDFNYLQRRRSSLPQNQEKEKYGAQSVNSDVHSLERRKIDPERDRVKQENDSRVAAAL